MVLHLGEDVVVFLSDIVAIMDIEKTTTTTISREFLKSCEENKRIKTIGTDIPKSFIVVVKNGIQTVYLSPISTSTLYKRAAKVSLD